MRLSAFPPVFLFVCLRVQSLYVVKWARGGFNTTSLAA